MKRKISRPGGGASAGGQRPRLPALVPRPSSARGRQASNDRLNERYKAIIRGSPSPVPVESPFEKSIYDGEDDE